MPGSPDAYAQNPANPSICGNWVEDKSQVSIYTGNIAWTMLGLLAYYEVAKGEEYLTVAKQMGDWVEYFCRDDQSSGGYKAGFPVWNLLRRPCSINPPNITSISTPPLPEFIA